MSSSTRSLACVTLSPCCSVVRVSFAVRGCRSLSWSRLLVGCGSVAAGPAAPPTPSAASAPTGRGIGPLPTSTPAADPPDADFPTPHPAFAEHFTDPIYHDQGDGFAPFGSDEGFDTLYTWQEHPEDLTACTTVRSMLGPEDAEPSGPSVEPAEGDPAADGLVVGVGFTLLLVTGHIDTEGKQLVEDAVRREAAYYDDESITRSRCMLRDLESFPPPTAPGNAV